MTHRIAILPGDGIGPEIMQAAETILECVSKKTGVQFECEWAEVGGAAIDACGKAMPESALRVCEDAEAVLLGTLGGPKWENLPPEEQPEQGVLLPLCRQLKVCVHIRNFFIHPEAVSWSPLKEQFVTDWLDFESVLFCEPPRSAPEICVRRCPDIMLVSTYGGAKSAVERAARLAFGMAMKRGRNLTLTDNTNVHPGMAYWRECARALAAEYPDVQLDYMYAHDAAEQLIRNPVQFDVLLTDAIIGDILGHECLAVTGIKGMAPSAFLDKYGFGIFTPACGPMHGIAGKNIANPIGQILSLAMLLRHSFGLEDEGKLITMAAFNAIRCVCETFNDDSLEKKITGTKEMSELVSETYMNTKIIDGSDPAALEKGLEDFEKAIKDLLEEDEEEDEDESL
ncbi:MAG: 3-isopropylmalate dehydrogenase [Spirochaetota bacterium]|jgi:3-isopropylmalate dehydrogenase|nr:3-isopropylmalate dehydrogenase [Spirochaetota bacterium]